MKKIILLVALIFGLIQFAGACVDNVKAAAEVKHSRLAGI